MKLIIISPPEFDASEIHLVEWFFENGLESYHIRKPNYSKEELHIYLNKFSKEALQKMVIHGAENFELLNEFNLKGIHHRSNTNFNPNWNCQQSKSFHELEEISINQHPYQYGFISPIFTSISKINYSKKFLEEDLKAINHTSKVPLIALGGINTTNLLNIEKLNFKGAAILGAIWQLNSVDDKMKCWKTLKNTSKKT